MPLEEDINDLGIVCWDMTPALRLRSSPSTGEGNIITSLAFSEVIQVVKRLPGKWLQVCTRDGQQGYVAADYIWLAPQHPLPEPDVRLHRVTSSLPGTAISIAERHFKGFRRWGHDLRFYVAVLAAVNHRPISAAVNGWKELRFKAGELIWLPSQEFAEALYGQVRSGSYTCEAAVQLGVAEALERVGQLHADFRKAIRLAMRHLGPAIRRHVEESLVSILTSLLVMAAGAVVLLALSTLVGAAIGFVLGAGAGAAPGAAAGFKVGLALLEWLGLGFLLTWVASSVTRIGTAFARFFSTVCSAQGDHHKLEQAALELAEAIGVCAGVFVEALVMWATAKGVNVALAQLKGTPLAKAFGESRLGTWLRERVSQYKEGDTKLPGPRETLVRVQAPELAKELGIARSEAETLLRMADFGTISSLKEYPGPSGFKLLLGRARATRETFFQALKQVGADGVARASLLEGLRLNAKGTLSNAHLQSALSAYLAFVSATQLADWVSSRIPNPRDNRATRWVEIFYRNTHGQIVRVVLELRSSRFEVYSTQAVR